MDNMAAFNITFNNYSDIYLSNSTNSSNWTLYTGVDDYMYRDDEQRHLYFKEIIILIQTVRLLTTLGLILNMSTIVILMSMKGSLKTQFKLILSLAVSDFSIDALHFIQTFYTFSIAFSPYAVVREKTSDLGFLLSLLYTTAQYAGLGTMFTIAVDILIKVRKPFRYQQLMSKKRGNVVITCLWLIPAFLLSAITLILSAKNIINDKSMICVLGSVFYCLFCFAFFFVFVAIYTVIVYSVRVSMNKTYGRNRRCTTKMAITFFLILVSFFVCTFSGLCIVFFAITDVLEPSLGDVTDLVLLFVACLYILNTLFDPIIYAVRIPEVRAHYNAICRSVCNCIRSLYSEPNA